MEFTWGEAGMQKARGTNEKVRLGLIGVGNRGSQLLASFMNHKDMEVAALCDVYEPYLARDHGKVDAGLLQQLGERIPEMGEAIGTEVPRYKDYRKLLEQKGLDAVVIATPDHWHAIMMIQACEAGLDVYVEKPLSVALAEGRKMVEVAQRTKRVVQVGLHRRSSKLYKQVSERVQAGLIGKVTVCRAYRISNMAPNGIGRMQTKATPPGLDWGTWLGPRAEQPYQDNVAPYKFRWWKAYSSQMANWGVHYCDAIRWVLGEEAPASISAHGGRFALEDDRDIPDTLEVIFEFASGCLLVFGQYEACGGEAIADGELEVRGTRGNLLTAAEGEGYKVVPTGGGQFQPRTRAIEREEVARMDEDLTDQHTRNFLDCVKSRAKCNADIETGHRSTSFALLANIALAAGNRVVWDAQAERIVSPVEANDLLQYEYRKPWSLG